MLKLKENITYPLYLYKDDDSPYKYRIEEKDKDGSLGRIGSIDDVRKILDAEDKDITESLIIRYFYDNPDFDDNLPWTKKPVELEKEKAFFEQYMERE